MKITKTYVFPRTGTGLIRVYVVQIGRWQLVIKGFRFHKNLGF